ncbi:MAG TPA: hypothetical protein VGN09_18495 [Vicinamibacteria bacterium]
MCEKVVEKASDGNAALGRSDEAVALDLAATLTESSLRFLFRSRRPWFLAGAFDDEGRLAVLGSLAAPRGVVRDPPSGSALKDAAVAPHRAGVYGARCRSDQS